jgi:hypothetical protein
MTINSLDIVFLTCVFLIPGYIIQEIIALFCPPKAIGDAKSFLSNLLYSIINCAIWSWAYQLLFNSQVKYASILFWIIILAITLLGAILLGFTIGILKNKDLFRKLIIKITKKTIMHPIPTSWDYKFSKIDYGNWIIVRLVDGKQVAGLYSSNSFSSSEVNERDLYIEEVYLINSNNEWIKQERTDGILINASEIRTIEFFK